MTDSTTKRLLAACTLALTVGSGPAFAHWKQGGGGQCGGGGMMGGGRMLHALDLSTDQQQKVQEIMSAHRPTLKQLAANERAARDAIATQMHGSGAVTQSDLDPLLQKEAQAHSALVHERLATALEVRGVLNSGQLEKAASIHANMKQLHAQMRALLGKGTSD
jgi:hypothetical protein